MGVIVGFIPWVLFWVLLSLGHSEPAALAGFLSILAIMAVDRMKGKSFKMLGLGTMAFFLALSIAAFFTELNKEIILVNLAANLTLFMITLISIAIRRPFSLQYARESAPKEAWDNPDFLRANYVISWVWCACFLTHLFMPVFRLAGASFPKWVGTTVTFGTLFLAMKFTAWYAKRLRARRMKAGS